ncbi:caspase recruitment domain-containing protein 18-like [Lemur catta]|uniref:caspase recruitment domain-containing protein 18-like n=1 Tax=Lemur catta TaxID=9447 RepID=UPI001E268484|nr:caspase recruitment domain-containing protein 18-like [Lemur catta]
MDIAAIAPKGNMLSAPFRVQEIGVCYSRMNSDFQEVNRKIMTSSVLCHPVTTYKILRKKRNLFIHSVGEGTINALLDDLLEDGVISQEEMYKVRYENCTVMDKARVLIDLVIGKGPRASQKFIRHIREEDPELAWKLYLPSE